jgi:hypothetical protein
MARNKQKIKKKKQTSLFNFDRAGLGHGTPSNLGVLIRIWVWNTAFETGPSRRHLEEQIFKAEYRPSL